MCGPLPHTDFFDVDPSKFLPATEAAEELEAAFDNTPTKVHELLTRDNTSLEEGDLLGITEEELKRGKVKGGPKDNRWYVKLNGKGQIETNLPFKRWLATLRFPRVQIRPGTSYEVRPIDDCTGSGLNWATVVKDKLVMEDFSTLNECTLIVADLWGQEPTLPLGTAPAPEVSNQPTLAKGDHEKAYRQWPVHPEDHPLVVTLVWDKAKQHFRAYVHLALPFGAVSAVWHYTRISQGMCHILRRLFAIPQLAYVDDFLRCVPR